MLERTPGIRLEGDRGDGILAARHEHQLARECSFTASELEDGLSRQQVYELAKGVRAPPHAVGGDRIAVAEVPVAMTLSHRERLDKRTVGVRGLAHGPNITTPSRAQKREKASPAVTERRA